MLAEYERLRELFIKNEEDGNTRINLFITLTTSLMGAFGISKHFEKSDNFQVGLLFFPVLIGLFFLGIFILRRILQRNIATDGYKDKFDRIRLYFLQYDSDLIKYLPYLPFKKTTDTERREKWKHWYSAGSGGYAQIMTLLNSFIFGFALIVLFSSLNLWINDGKVSNDNYNSIILNIIFGSVAFFSTLIIYVRLHQWVLQWYKDHQKEKIDNNTLSFSKILESIMPQEEELSFIILSDDPENIIERIKNTPKIERYELVKSNRIIKITDTYYDVIEEILQKNKYSLRMRIEENEEEKFLTFKGPTKINDSGNPTRIEVEKEWKISEIKTILLELKKLIPWINIQLDQSNFDLNPHTVLEKIGLKEIQKRKTKREEIGVLVQDPFKLATEFAKFYIDHVTFFFDENILVKYYNIEIEINKNGIELDQLKNPSQDRYSYFLSDFKKEFLLRFPKIKEWPHSKYLTGKAIQTLIYTNDFKDSIDEKGNLLYTEYKKIDNLIKEKKL
jgi:hypothetical protein